MQDKVNKLGSYNPFHSPSCSAQFNTNFKSIFGCSEANASAVAVSSSTTYQPPPMVVSNLPISTCAVLDSSSVKAYQLEQQQQQPAAQSAFATFFPKTEPTSPGSCLHTTTPMSTATNWWQSTVRPMAVAGPWSARPLQTTHSTFMYPNGTTGFRPLSPLSPISPMTAPATVHPLPLYPASGSGESHQQLTHVDALHWQGIAITGSYFDPSGTSQRCRLRRMACTCPNCTNGNNSKATNPDGTLKKKQHICHYPGCGKVYGKTSHLRVHLRSHTGERPFICNWSFCGRRFTRSDELHRHFRSHTGEKRFKCTECSKGFLRSDHLSKHMTTHQKNNKKTGKPGSSPLSSLSPSDCKELDTEFPPCITSPPDATESLTIDDSSTEILACGATD